MRARVRFGFVYQCERARARVCVCVRACDVLCMCIQFVAPPCTDLERPELSVAFEFDPWTSFYNYMTTLGEKKLMRRKKMRFLFTCRTPFKAIFVWVSERYVKGSLGG